MGSAQTVYSDQVQLAACAKVMDALTKVEGVYNPRVFISIRGLGSTPEVAATYTRSASYGARNRSR